MKMKFQKAFDKQNCKRIPQIFLLVKPPFKANGSIASGSVSTKSR